MSKTSSLLRSLAGSVIVLPIAAIILGAIWLAGTSAFETMHLNRATEQILSAVAAARDYAGREKNFALQPGEDIFASLARVGTMGDIIPSSPAHLVNPWGGGVTASAASPTSMRIEAEMPARDCRHLALFFAKAAPSLGLEIMEARQQGSTLWRRFLDQDQQPLTDSRPIEAACGDESSTALALVFRLH